MGNINKAGVRVGAAGRASQGDIKDLKKAGKEPMGIPGVSMSQAESIPYAKAPGWERSDLDSKQ